MKNIELLSPCGDMDSFIGAINNGANAVYLGGKNFSARKSANNFTNEEIKEIVQIGNKLNVKIYLTVNTLYKNDEINELLLFLDEMYIIGIDAFIIQDIGLFSIIKNRYPKVEIHGSTQLCCHSLEDVRYMEELGFDRIVLSREMSLEDIKLIRTETNIELEVFGHGALCVSYSGQCLMSSMIGGRSGNRGSCAQSCRMSYELVDKDRNTVCKNYLLSPKDIQSIEYINELNDCGVASIKLEGRMKNANYVSYITKLYRHKIDNIDSDNKDIIKELTKIFNRGGALSTGYFDNYSSKGMMSNNTPKATGVYVGKVIHYSPKNNKATILLEDDLIPGDGIEIWSSPHVGTGINKASRAGDKISVFISGNIKKEDLVFKSYNKALNDLLKNDYIKINKKSKIKGSIVCKLNETIKFKVNFKDVEVEIEGSVVSEAINKPTEKSVIIEKLSQTGNTLYDILFDEIEIDNNIFVSIKELKNIRRDALAQLDELINKSIIRDINNVVPDIKKYNTSSDKKINVYLNNPEKINSIINLDVNRVYLPIDKVIKSIFKYIKICKQNNIELYIALPAISETDDEILLSSQIQSLNSLDINGFLVSNYGQIKMVKKDIMYNMNFNIYNAYSRDFFNSNVVLSAELNLKEINDIANNNTEVIIHGYLPVMETKQCPIGLYVANKDNSKFCNQKNKNNEYYLVDRKNKDFKVETNCNYCNATIYNSDPIITISKIDNIKKINSNYRINIIDEEPEEIVKTYIDLIKNNKKDADGSVFDKIYSSHTLGHFYRGVD